MNRKEGSGRHNLLQKTTKADFEEELICSQPIASYCHLVASKIVEETKIKCLSIRRVIKGKDIAI